MFFSTGNSVHGPLDFSMYPGVDIRHGRSTLFCVGLHFTLECAKRLLSSPGGAWGWPGTSLAIAESIRDASERVVDLYEAIYTQGDRGGEPGRFHAWKRSSQKKRILPPRFCD